MVDGNLECAAWNDCLVTNWRFVLGEDNGELNFSAALSRPMVRHRTCSVTYVGRFYQYDSHAALSRYFFRMFSTDRCILFRKEMIYYADFSAQPVNICTQLYIRNMDEILSTPSNNKFTSATVSYRLFPERKWCIAWKKTDKNASDKFIITEMFIFYVIMTNKRGDGAGKCVQLKHAKWGKQRNRC